MKKKTSSLRADSAPFTDGSEAMPHYDDTMFEADITPTPAPTPPNDEPTASGSLKLPKNLNAKLLDMQKFRRCDDGKALTSNQGVKIADNQNTLRAGSIGPALLEDFHFLEKMAHFDRERIPERVVHARGSGAHGYFQVYHPLARYTCAEFLQNPDEKTPVFVRFSTVQGFRGSPDTVRDIRGWATKFYTKAGNFDLVGNNTGVFFIQDPIKFPDFVHAVKPEPHNEIPQAQSAHDSFWDYVSLQPETLHNVMWAMSDRGIPRSFRTMEGFGIHTYKLVNADGKSTFVRFHWKPVAGKKSLIWDEAQELTGRDPDFHRRDLWQAIEAGDYPEYELCLQLIPEDETGKFNFDILDPTKIIPEAIVPATPVGKMTLNRNPDNFFAETEQAAFCPANIVPGIDFSDDPLLQGRIFSYSDSQRHRLGGPNFTHLPINRPLTTVNNHNQDGFNRMSIKVGAANYEPNSTDNNWPRETPPAQGSFATHPAPVSGVKERLRSRAFMEYYAHPRLFWLSQTATEQQHIINAFSFELGKVMRPYIRARVVDLLTRVDTLLASAVAKNLGIELTVEQLSRDMPAPVCGLEKDTTLSLYAKPNGNIKGCRVALLAADGVSLKSVHAIADALHEVGVHPQIIAPHMGTLTTDEGDLLLIQGTLEGNPSVLFDAVIVPDGEESIRALMADGHAKYHLRQAYKHLKAIALPGKAAEMLTAAELPQDESDEGLIVAKNTAAAMKPFIAAMNRHRTWAREPKTSSFTA